MKKVALITGAGSGIGRITGIALANQGYRVILAGRNPARLQPVVEEIRAQHGADAAALLQIDLADLASVRSAADKLLAMNEPLHLLINNAGVAGPRGMTRDGFEMAFGTNHLGHYLLTRLLLDRLQATGNARIVAVASKAHRRVPGWDWAALTQPTQSLTGVREYGLSKLANILFVRSLARRLKGSGVSCYALHPGVIYTEIWREVPAFLRPLLKLRRSMIPLEAGALTTLHCALEAAEADSGKYFDRSAVAQPTALACDDLLAEELWDKSETWVRAYL